MKTFEYVMVMLSILLGACIAQLMTNFVQNIQATNTADIYLPHILWNVLGCIVILAHWVHLYQAESLKEWNALQIAILFLTPMLYYATAQILGQAPTIDGKPDYRMLLDSKRHLIYLTAAAFTVLTIGQNYFIYGVRNSFLYAYYGFAVIILIGRLFITFPYADLLISGGFVLSETVHHFIINPLSLKQKISSQTNQTN